MTKFLIACAPALVFLTGWMLYFTLLSDEKPRRRGGCPHCGGRVVRSRGMYICQECLRSGKECHLS